jgi:hypothetical protein
MLNSKANNLQEKLTLTNTKNFHTGGGKNEQDKDSNKPQQKM